jgi:hypothetical protein
MLSGHATASPGFMPGLGAFIPILISDISAPCQKQIVHIGLKKSV